MDVNHGKYMMKHDDNTLIQARNEFVNKRLHCFIWPENTNVHQFSSYIQMLNVAKI